MSKKSSKSKGPLASSLSKRPSDTDRFIEVAERMKVANTASLEIARSKLQEMGILSDDGRLSDKYK